MLLTVHARISIIIFLRVIHALFTSLVHVSYKLEQWYLWKTQRLVKRTTYKVISSPSGKRIELTLFKNVYVICLGRKQNGGRKCDFSVEVTYYFSKNRKLVEENKLKCVAVDKK